MGNMRPGRWECWGCSFVICDSRVFAKQLRNENFEMFLKEMRGNGKKRNRRVDYFPVR